MLTVQNISYVIVHGSLDPDDARISFKGASSLIYPPSSNRKLMEFLLLPLNTDSFCYQRWILGLVERKDSRMDGKSS